MKINYDVTLNFIIKTQLNGKLILTLFTIYCTCSHNDIDYINITVSIY